MAIRDILLRYEPPLEDLRVPCKIHALPRVQVRSLPTESGATHSDDPFSNVSPVVSQQSDIPRTSASSRSEIVYGQGPGHYVAEAFRDTAEEYDPTEPQSIAPRPLGVRDCPTLDESESDADRDDMDEEGSSFMTHQDADFADEHVALAARIVGDDVLETDSEADFSQGELEIHEGAGVIARRHDSEFDDLDIHQEAALQGFVGPAPGTVVSGAPMTPTASAIDLRSQATPSPQRQQMVAAEAAAVSTILSAQPAAPTLAVGGNPPVPVFRFGEKHRNQNYEEVTEQDPGYFFWAIAEPAPAPVLLHYINWVKQH